MMTSSLICFLETLYGQKLGMFILRFVSSRMTGDACITGDAYPVDAPDLTPLCESSCNSTTLSTDFVTLTIGQRYSTYIYFQTSNFFLISFILNLNMTYISTKHYQRADRVSEKLITLFTLGKSELIVNCLFAYKVLLEIKIVILLFYSIQLFRINIFTQKKNLHFIW